MWGNDEVRFAHNVCPSHYTGSGSESADDDPVSVPNDVTLPTNFILPNFTTVKSNEESIDIFNFDHRSIEEIWIDYSKAYFTEHTQPSSDWYVLGYA